MLQLALPSTSARGTRMTRLLLLSLLLAGVCQAQIYKSVDRDGNVTFSDRPPSGREEAEAVELKPLNTAPAPEALPEPSSRREKAGDEGAAAEPDIRVTSPQPDQVVPIGDLGNLTVNVAVEPPLSGGEHLQLYLDGTPQGGPQRANQWQLEGLPRGGHDLRVDRLGMQGQVRASSDTIRFYVMRPLNIRNRPSTPAPQ